MWLNRVSLASVLLLATGSAIASFKPNAFFPQSVAQNLGEQQGGMQSEFMLMEKLNVTPHQRQKLKAIYVQYKDQIWQRKQAARQATQELRDLMVGTASADEVRNKYREVQAVRQQLEADSFESMLAVRDVLTPTQRIQFAQLMQQQGRNPSSRVGYQRGQ